MAGDLGISERAILDEAGDPAALAASSAGAVIHRYGRVGIVAAEPNASLAAVPGQRAADLDRGDLAEVERLGLQALQLRDSAEDRTAKDPRPRNGEQWDMPDCTTVVDTPQIIRQGAAAPAPTSSYLQGSVAVGIIIVEGPGGLAFTAAQRVKVVAEVQNGLGWYATTNPPAGLTFSYDFHVVTLTLPASGGAS